MNSKNKKSNVFMKQSHFIQIFWSCYHLHSLLKLDLFFTAVLFVY